MWAEKINIYQGTFASFLETATIATKQVITEFDLFELSILNGAYKIIANTFPIARKLSTSSYDPERISNFRDTLCKDNDQPHSG